MKSHTGKRYYFFPEDSVSEFLFSEMFLRFWTPVRISPFLNLFPERFTTVSFKGIARMATNSATAMYASRFFSHHSQTEVNNLLPQLHRILMPGGILRISVYDMDMALKVYIRQKELLAIKPNASNRLAYEWSLLFFLDEMHRDVSGGAMREFLSKHGSDLDVIRETTGLIFAKEGFKKFKKRRNYFNRILKFVFKTIFPHPRNWREPHRWHFDQISLEKLLSENGFVNIRHCAFSESGIDGFESCNPDKDVKSGHCIQPSFFIEASKK